MSISRPVLAGLRHRVLAGNAERQVRPPEHARPLVLLPHRQRRDAGGLELADVVEELVPRGGRRVDPGLLEERLVVPEPHHAQIERHAVLLAVDLVEPDGRVVEVADPVRGGVADVLDEAGVGLLLERAAAPRLEHVGHVARLHVRGQLRLERLVLEHRDLDLHVRVVGLVLLGRVRPDRLHGVVVLDVPPLDGHRTTGLAGTPVAAVVVASAPGGDQCHRGDHPEHPPNRPEHRPSPPSSDVSRALAHDQ
jgi:hypothetical protein